jgi:hypothetical protein
MHSLHKVQDCLQKRRGMIFHPSKWRSLTVSYVKLQTTHFPFLLLMELTFKLKHTYHRRHKKRFCPSCGFTSLTLTSWYCETYFRKKIKTWPSSARSWYCWRKHLGRGESNNTWPWNNMNTKVHRLSQYRKKKDVDLGRLSCTLLTCTSSAWFIKQRICRATVRTAAMLVVLFI